MTDEILDQTSPPVATAEKEQRRTRWLLWLQWVLVSAVGWAFLAWANERFSGSVFERIGLGAVCMALGQWLVLRPRLARAGWWVLVTPVGLTLGHSAVLVYIYLAGWQTGWPNVSLGLLGMLLVGTPVGVLQWLVLRRQMRRALWWLPVTVVAIGASYLVLWLCLMALAQRPVDWYALVDGYVDAADLAATALGGFVAGAVYGAGTGAALAVLLPHPVQARPRKPLRPRLVVGIALLSLLAICLGWGILVEPVNAPHMLVQHRFGRRAFSGVHLEGADLSFADLIEADLSGANLSGANLSSADLRRADLSDADLSGAIPYDADLRKANLRRANLSGANLIYADLSGANLSDAALSRADLSGADLTGADLSDADLTGANVSDADLSGADLTRANLRGAVVTDEQLAATTSLKGATMPDGTVHE